MDIDDCWVISDHRRVCLLVSQPVWVQCQPVAAGEWLMHGLPGLRIISFIPGQAI
jgi:hypothetical protein